MAQGQEAELDSDRPSLTQSPVVVPRGTWQLETGFQYQRDEAGPLVLKQYLYPELLVRIGLLQRAELRLNANYRQDRTVGDNPGFPSFEQSGVDRVLVGTKIHLADGNGAVPAVGLLANLELPLGGSPYEPPRAAPEGRLLFESELSEKVKLEYNAGYRKRYEGDVDWGEFIYSVSGDIKMSDSFQIFVEYFGLKPGTRAVTAENRLNAGGMLKLQSNLQWDLIAGTGLSERAPQLLFGTGLTWRIPR